MQISEQLLNILHNHHRTSDSIEIQETITFLTHYQEVVDHPELIQKLISIMQMYVNTDKRIRSLSPRESQVFNLIGLGFSTKEIALSLKLSIATVSTHRKKIIKKMKLHGAGKLSRLAFLHIKDLEQSAIIEPQETEKM